MRYRLALTLIAALVPTLAHPQTRGDSLFATPEVDSLIQAALVAPNGATFCVVQVQERPGAVALIAMVEYPAPIEPLCQGVSAVLLVREPCVFWATELRYPLTILMCRAPRSVIFHRTRASSVDRIAATI